jgi:hypothetical protein
MTDDDGLIRAQVAQVLNSTDLAINRGSKDGVEVGMRFAILSDRGADIKDPVTGEVLDVGQDHLGYTTRCRWTDVSNQRWQQRHCVSVGLYDGERAIGDSPDGRASRSAGARPQGLVHQSRGPSCAVHRR